MLNQFLVKAPSLIPKLPPGAGTSQLKLLHTLYHVEWGWALYFSIGLFLVFACILFAVLFIKRWQTPRLGFFLFTASTFVVRVMRPTDKFWNVCSAAGVALALFLLFSTKKTKRVDLKEPIYYLLNAFTLLLITFELASYTSALAAMSLCASLFFMNTKSYSRHHKYDKLIADPNIMESLEKRSKRQL
jgi:hypothetical protein